MSETTGLGGYAWQAAVALGGAAAAAAGAWAKGWLGTALPPPGQVARFLRFRLDELRGRTPAYARDGRFLAVLCCLDGDDAQETMLKALARAFDAHEAMDVALDWRRLGLGGAARGPAREAAQLRALEIARLYRADVILWGEVAKAGEGLRLHLQGGGQSETRDLIFDKGFLKEEIRKEFAGAVGAIVVAAALASVRPITEQQGQYLAATLKPVAARLSRLVERGLDAVPPADRGALHLAHGDALAVIGEQSGDDGALRRAVAAYEAALGEHTRERVPLDWATTQNNLGNALRVLGERGDDGALRRAVAACEAALGERTRERVPLDWATTQNNLGNALQVLGERGGDGALRRAVAAFEAALGVFERHAASAYATVARRNLAQARASLEAMQRAAPGQKRTPPDSHLDKGDGVAPAPSPSP